MFRPKSRSVCQRYGSPPPRLDNLWVPREAKMKAAQEVRRSARQTWCGCQSQVKQFFSFGVECHRNGSMLDHGTALAIDHNHSDGFKIPDGVQWFRCHPSRSVLAKR